MVAKHLSDFFDVPSEDQEKESNKKLFVDHMNMLRNMSNEEYTLYKKWIEIQEQKSLVAKAPVIKASIWTPRDITNKDTTIEDINNLDPEVIFVHPSDKKLVAEWTNLRIFIHSMEFEQNPGRFLRYLMRDKTTGKYLGVASAGSDVISVTCRDKWIGWKDIVKINGGKLKNTAIATTIVPTQPLGYNLLGGKLVASLLCLPTVRDSWEEMYGDVLVGLTTTSLFGKHSMYQRIPFWKELGETTGKIMLKPIDEVYDVWHHWIKEHEAEKYQKKTLGGGEGPATGVKQKILVMIMQELNMKQSQYMHGFQRGVYYAPFYENTREFLRGEIGREELLPLKRLQGGKNTIMEWWRQKAVARYLRVYDSNRIKPEILFYDSMYGMTWEKAKKTYLSDVGR